MKTTAWLAALVAVAATIVIVEETRIAGLRKQLTAASGTEIAASSPDPAGGEASAVPRQGRVMPDKRLTKTDREIEVKRGGPEAGDNEKGDADDQSLKKSLRKMVENPAGRAMINQGVRAMAGVWYADLIGKLDLNKEEEKYFLDLIAGGFATDQELGMKLMSAKDAAEREALIAESKQAKEDQKDAIKEFLNDEDDYGQYEAFQERLPERQQLDGLRAVMNEAGQTLNPEQETQVIEALHQARTSQAGRTAWEGSGGMDLMAQGKATEKFEQDWVSYSSSAAAEVGKVLDGEQLDAFNNYLKQVKEMQLMGIKMAEQMFKQDGSGGK